MNPLWPSADRVLDILVQSHRFVMVHHCINYYFPGCALRSRTEIDACTWLKSFLGYMILLHPGDPIFHRMSCFLRAENLNPMNAVLRMNHEVHHNTVIKGMLMMQALDGNLFVPHGFPCTHRACDIRPGLRKPWPSCSQCTSKSGW